MTQEFQEHWLSAYLDDELSSEERALVEQRLQVDPSLGNLLEDLKRLRGMVSSMPQWQGNFKFDPTGLSIDPVDVSDQPADSVPPTKLASQRMLPKPGMHSRGGDGYGTQRAILALAASAILVLLGGGYLWNQYGKPFVAWQTDDKESIALGGGGGGGGAPEPMAAGETVNAEPERKLDESAQFGKDVELQQMEAIGQTTDSLARSLALSDSVAPPSPAMAGAPLDAPHDPAMIPPVVDSAKGLDENQLAQNAAKGQLYFDSELSRAKQKSEAKWDESVTPDVALGMTLPSSPELPAAPASPAAPAKPAGPADLSRVAEADAPSSAPVKFLCARSSAWTDQEAQQSLAEVESLLPARFGSQQTWNAPQADFAPGQARGAVSGETGGGGQVAERNAIGGRVENGRSEEGQRGSGQAPPDFRRDVLADQLATASDKANSTPAAPIITGLVSDASNDDWYYSVQQVQPLTELSILPQTLAIAELKNDVDTFAVQPDNAPAADARVADARVADAKSSQPAEQKLNEAAEEKLEQINRYNFNVPGVDAKKRTNPEQPQGTMVLFVTQAEAEKILQTVQTPATQQSPAAHQTPRYWRVVPAEAKAKTQVSPDQKVILILNKPG